MSLKHRFLPANHKNGFPLVLQTRKPQGILLSVLRLTTTRLTSFSHFSFLKKLIPFFLPRVSQFVVCIFTSLCGKIERTFALFVVKASPLFCLLSFQDVPLLICSYICTMAVFSLCLIAQRPKNSNRISIITG